MNVKTFLRNNWSILIVLILTPVLLHVVLPILPTHDDWAGTTKPDFNPFFIKERFLFYGYHWRPFDAIIGYIVGQNPQQLYPTFNHCVVVIGHAVCTYFVFKLLTILGYSPLARNLSALLFFILPATMATVTAIDSMNQVYALTCGIISFMIYLARYTGHHTPYTSYFAWAAMLFIAAWWKENGLMWAFICPILAFGFNFIDRQQLKKDMIIAMAMIAVYAMAIFLLPKDIIIHPEYEPGMMKVVKNGVKFLFTTFITIDYVWLLHQPSRNLWAALLTFLPTIPLFYFIFIKNIRWFFNKKMLSVVLCLLIAVAPHIGTVFSMMHTYAGLAMLAVIVAYSIDRYKQPLKHIAMPFILFCLACLFIDAHLVQRSVESGLIGKRMAQEAIRQTDTPVDSVYVVIIEDDYPKLSSFCVIPNDAFGWGLAARYETNYQWPKVIEDTTIERTTDYIQQAEAVASEKLSHHLFDCVWIVDHDKLKIIKP